MADKPVCKIDGCDKTAKARGWCGTHWWRWRHHGDPLYVAPALPETCTVAGCVKSYYASGFCHAHYSKMYRNAGTLGISASHGEALKFCEEAARHSDHEECLIWPFTETGYARLSVDGVGISAHRYVCTLAHGEPPSEDSVAAHGCGKGHLGCVNPHHLRWASQKENIADSFAHGTFALGEAHGRSKLTSEQAKFIFNERRMSRDELAEIFGVSRQNISFIQRGITWRHVNGEFRERPK